jgi:hypothetical protein
MICPIPGKDKSQKGAKHKSRWRGCTHVAPQVTAHGVNRGGGRSDDVAVGGHEEAAAAAVQGYTHTAGASGTGPRSRVPLIL